MIITSIFVGLILLAETLKDHMIAIAKPDIFWFQGHYQKHVLILTNAPELFMHAIVMLLATTMTEATLANVTWGIKISMVMEKFVKISMSVLFKLINAIR